MKPSLVALLTIMVLSGCAYQQGVLHQNDQNPKKVKVTHNGQQTTIEVPQSAPDNTNAASQASSTASKIISPVSH
jgi:hypothetical protein